MAKEKPNIIDIHCHILPGVDDGPKFMEQSLLMASIAQEKGINQIVATPHYIESEFETKKDDIIRGCNELNNAITQNNIKLKVLPGSEIFVSPNLLSKLKNNELTTLNDTGKYILIELFMENYLDYIDDVVFNLKVRGVTPIIAHIERYRYIKKRYEIVYRLIKEGALIQVNSYSILGKGGSFIQHKIMDLFKHNLVHFIASDSHSPQKNPPDIFSAINLLKRKKILGDSYIDYLVGNAEKVVNGEDVSPITPKEFVTRRFFI